MHPQEKATEPEVARPLQLIHVGGVTTQAPETLGVSKVDSPFARSTVGISRGWEDRIGKVVEQILGFEEVRAPFAALVGEISVLGFAGQRKSVKEFVLAKIEQKCVEIADKLKECRDPAEFAQKIGQVRKNLKVMNGLFACFETDFEGWFYEKSKDVWVGRGVMTSACQLAVQALSRDEQREHGVLILECLDSMKALNDQTVMSEIARPLMAMIHSVSSVNANGDRQQLFLACYDTFAKICGSLPKILQATISSGFTTTLIKGDFRAFIEAVVPHVLKVHTDWTSFIYSSTNTMETVAELVRAIEGLGFDVQRILSIQKAIYRWPPHLRKLVENALRGLTAGHAKELSLAIVQELHNHTEGEPKLSFVEALGLIDNQEEFESLYAQELLAHCIAGDTQFDRYFVKQYIQAFSRAQAVKFTSILEDYDNGNDVIAHFANATTPAYMNYTLLWGGHWNVCRYMVQYPEDVSNALCSFATYFTELPSSSKKRVEYDPTLSTVVLEASGIVVRCDALVGTVLLAISKGVSSIQHLRTSLEMAPNVLEAVIHVLMSDKVGRICQRIGGDLHLCLSPDTPREIEIPTVVKKSEYSQTSNGGLALLMSQNSQIDAHVLRLLKTGGSSNARNLFQRVKKLVKFNISEEVFQERLDQLEKRYFVHQDSSKNYSFCK